MKWIFFGMDSSYSFTTQFVINNLSPEQREFLIKKEIREQICTYADVKIAIRGRYIKPKKDGSLIVGNERPLHLHISGPTKHSLALAMKKIQLLLKSSDIYDKNIVSEDLNLEEKITIGIEVFPSIFQVKLKVLGENNENVKYIAKETGAIISLRGKGSGFHDQSTNTESFDPLHIFVKYKNVESRDNARQLLINLIETVQQEFIDTCGKMHLLPKKPEIIPVRPLRENNMKTPPPSKKNNLTDNAKGTIEKITIGLDRVPPTFNLKSKIYGPNLTNVKHIEKVTNALLLVENKGCNFDKKDDESYEAPYILVKYLKPEQKVTARSLILNLIETIHQEFIALYGTYPIKPKKPEIIPLKTLSNTTASNHPNFPKSCTSSNTLKLLEKKGPIEPIDTPVPPPPPIISKAVSLDYIKVPTVISCATVSSSIGPFHGKSTGSRAISFGLDINEVPPADAFDVSANSGISESFGPPPVLEVISQSAISNTVFSSFQSNSPVDSTPFYHSDDCSNQNQNTQYFKKKSDSPVEIFPENKKFCNRPNNDGLNVGPVTNIPCTQRAKVRNTPSRYLVPLQEVNTVTIHSDVVPIKSVTTVTQPASTSTTTELKNVTVESKETLPINGNQEKEKIAFLDNSRKRMKSVAFPNRLNYCKDDFYDEEKECVILIDSDDDVTFENTDKNLRENNGKKSRCTMPNMCTAAVQTDDSLFELDMKNIECACGRFTRVITPVRSWGTQTSTSNFPRKY